MRKAILVMTLIALFILTGGLPALADLFQSAPPSAPLPPANPELVVRQRAVSIDWKELPFETNGVMRLNLFTDVALRVTCEAITAGPGGSRIWYGRLAGDPPLRVTMVVTEDRLAATIRLPEATYKVRPHDEFWHLVREIVPSGGAELWAAAATSEERTVWSLTNQERSENGLSGLSLNGHLVASSRAHSADMGAQNYFDHSGLDGSSPGDRIAATGYEASSWGENIAAGYATPQLVVDGWMNSPGHRANILSDSYCDIGVGYAYDADSQYRQYWTQNFGRQRGVSDCPAVSDDSGGSGDSGTGDVGDGDASGDGGDSGGGCFIRAGAVRMNR